jgi:hypothetical protein
LEVEASDLTYQFDDVSAVQEIYQTALEKFLSVCRPFIKSIPLDFLDARLELTKLEEKIGRDFVKTQDQANKEIEGLTSSPKMMSLVRSQSRDDLPEANRLIHLLGRVTGLESLKSFRHIEYETVQLIQSLETLADEMDFFFNQERLRTLEPQKTAFQSRLSALEKDIVAKSVLFFEQFTALNQENGAKTFLQIIELLKMRSRLQNCINQMTEVMQGPKKAINIKYMNKGGEEKTHHIPKGKWHQIENQLRSQQSLVLLSESWKGGNSAVLRLLFHFQDGLGYSEQDPAFTPNKECKSFKAIYRRNNEFVHLLLNPSTPVETLKIMLPKIVKENELFLLSMTAGGNSALTHHLKKCEKWIGRQKNTLARLAKLDKEQLDKIRAPRVMIHHNPYTPEGLILELMKAGGSEMVKQIQSTIKSKQS